MVFLSYPQQSACCLLGLWWQQDGERARSYQCCALKGGKQKGPWSFPHPDDVWEPLLLPVTSLVPRDLLVTAMCGLAGGTEILCSGC